MTDILRAKQYATHHVIDLVLWRATSRLGSCTFDDYTHFGDDIADARSLIDEAERLFNEMEGEK